MPGHIFVYKVLLANEEFNFRKTNPKSFIFGYYKFKNEL